MQAMIDHTAAVVIGATILFILLALGVRSNDSSIEATQVDIAKTELRSLIDLVEQDVNNMGGGMGDPNVSAAERVVWERGTEVIGGNTFQKIVFRANPDETTPTPQFITYRWRQDGTAALPDGTIVDIYDVERESDGRTARFENATNFNMVMRYETLGAMTSTYYADGDSLAAVRYIDVDLGVIPPIGTEDLIQQTRWSKRFRPINLEPKSKRIIASPP